MERGLMSSELQGLVAFATVCLSVGEAISPSTI